MNKYIINFINYIQSVKGSARNTMITYENVLVEFLRFMQERKNISKDINITQIKQIDISDIHAYLSYIDNNLKNVNSTRAKKIAAIKSWYNYLYKMQLINKNIAFDIESPKISSRLPKYLTLEESIRLLSVISGDFAERDLAIMTLFLNCGLRLSELIQINILDINNRVIKIIGKGDKERQVFLNDLCMNNLNKYIQTRNSDDVALFLGIKNKRISRKCVWKLVKKYLTIIGRPDLSPHKLRHTAATLMYQNGVDIKVLQEILGHSKISTTEIYTHTNKDQIIKAMDLNPINLKLR
jgi:integrase/recombinase XerD